MNEDAKAKLLAELLEVQKMLEEKIEVQDHKIKKLQALITEEDMFSQIVDCCPYPIAVFTPNGRLATQNQAFAAQTNTGASKAEDAMPGILTCGFLHNQSFIRAIKKVFSGKTFFLESLDNPASASSSTEGRPAERFGKAIVFPVTDDDENVTHGVLVLIH